MKALGKGKRSTAFAERFSFRSFLPGLTYEPANTALHRMHPLLKLELLLCFSVLVFTLSHYLCGLLLFAILLGGYWAAGLGFKFFWRRLRFILVFSLFIFVVHIVFVREGVLLWRDDLWGLRLEIWSLGLNHGLLLVFRFLNTIGASYLFVVATDPNKLAYALMQAGLPYRYGFMLITALRFIPLFFQEMEQVRRAQMAKGIEIEKLSLKNFTRAVRYLFVPLVLSALSKVDTLTISMESRAFGLHPRRSYLESQPFSGRHRLAALAILVAAAGLFLLLREYNMEVLY
ncbi:MAG: energy-coupling factor transporter transmembrane protein EcfT [Firmicutes bacterium]|nr:energy-coupling factor transporter transmembrane protein EcfT [Bacillota bacterium]